MSMMIDRAHSNNVAEFPAPAPHALVGALEIVAHDLRGPLANLAMLVESMTANSGRGAHENVAKNARSAQRVIGKLDEMIGAVLERARTNGDPLAFTPTNIDFVEIVEQAAALNMPFAQSRWVRVHTYCVEPLTVHGDKQLLFELLDNLISNAIKYTRPRSLVVVEAARARDGGVVVHVSDEGPGLSDNDRARAFRPFTRLSTQSTASIPSTGLGLWIARVIARRHGGHIEAKNRTGREGAMFTLHLPAQYSTPDRRSQQ